MKSLAMRSSSPRRAPLTAAILRLACLAVLGLLAQCGASTPTSPAVSDASSADATSDANSCPGGAGCSCQNDSNCAASSACIATSTGKRCAAPCVDGQCPQGFACTALSKVDQSGQPKQVANLCVAQWPTACDPCLHSSSCAIGPLDAACVASGGPGSEQFCAPACGANSLCPEGFACKPTVSIEGVAGSRCWPSSGSCSCSPAAILAQKTTTCRAVSDKVAENVPLGVGCIGQRICQAEGLSACSSPQPQSEICNGLDDNCDGNVDEGTPDSAALCNDQDASTDDSCDGSKGCVHTAKSGPCDDGDACSQGDIWTPQGCKGVAVVCDDKNPCTNDSCLPATGCTSTANDAACDDGSLCSVGDQCTAGSCQGKDLNCNDNLPCTVDTCAPATGCQNATQVGLCDDGNACTGEDACLGPLCAGTPLSCDDGYACTADACDPASGCTHTTAADCGSQAVPIVQEFSCGQAGLDQWQFGDPPAFATPGQLAFRVAPAMGLSADVSGCVLQANGGKDLQCLDGGIAVLTSPWYLPSGKSSLILSFDSAGQWPPASLASVLTRNSPTGPWQKVASIDAGSLSFSTISLPLSAGPIEVRLRFESACGVSGTGWFIRNFKLFEDTCTTGGAGCDSAATCSYGAEALAQCTCKPGYSGDGKICNDVDECASNPSPCDANALCSNLPGSYNCACNSGYAGDGVSCSDVNECLVNNGGCSSMAACKNLPGSLSCTCIAGYQGDGKTCADIDECAAKTDNCNSNALCTNTPGAFTCACNSGFAGNGLQCTDIDECATKTASCDAKASCTNTVGSYTCACASGYSGDGKTCTDINECLINNGGCSATATCTNSPGSSSCACKAGYSGDGKTCTDINECLTNNGGCSANAICTNAPGSSSCACASGYTGDGKTCTDVNECLLNNGGCSVNATCTNAVGSFSCACKAGYSGNGVACALIGGADAPAASCLQIYKANPASASGSWWLDIDGAGPLAKAQYYCDMTGGGWTLVGSDTFDSTVQGWSGATLSSCGAWGSILGGYNVISGSFVSKGYTPLPSHTTAHITLNYLRIDSWDNETAYLKVDGAQVWSKVGYLGNGTNVCGAAVPTWYDENWPIDWSGAHSAATLTLVAGSLLDQAANDESFGIDNVAVWVK